MRVPIKACIALVVATAQVNPQSVSDQVRQRTGLELPPVTSDDAAGFSLPPGVTSTERLTARDAVAIALWNNADLQADLAALEVSRADLTEAALFKNPSLSTLFPVGPKPFELLLAWPIEELWQRKQRVKAAQLNVDSVATGLVQNGLNLIRDVRLAHTDLWLAETRSRALQESSGLRGRIATFAERRRDAGDGTGLDVTLARADSQSNAELARISLGDIEVSRARLRYLLGMRQTDPPLSVAPTLPSPQSLPPLAALFEVAAANRPDLRAAEINVQAAAERAKWQRSQVLAMLAPTLSIKEVGAEGVRVGPGLNMEIPILSRNQGKISRADAEVVRAGKQYAALRGRIENEVVDAYTRTQQAQSSLTRLQQQVRPTVEQSIQLSQRAYENGDILLLNVLEATRQRHDVDLREAETNAALHRAFAELERAVGEKSMRNLRSIPSCVVFTVLLAFAACQTDSPKPASPKPEPPAKLSGTAVKEAELTSINLTEEAEKRLGIRVEEARVGRGSEVRQFAGEVTALPGSTVLVSSPVAGTLQARGPIPPIGSTIRKDQPLFSLTPFLPLPRDLKSAAEGEVAQARTRVETARQRKARADRMLADEVGTVRAQEEAAQELALATTALEVAQNRLRQVQAEPFANDLTIQIQAPQDGILRQVFAAPGQTVSAGASVFEVANLGEVWIRVPVYAGEAQQLASNTAVTVQAINGSGPTWTAQPVAAPPTASSTSSTVDLYYRIPNDALRFKPGEKVTINIRAAGSRQRGSVEVPWSAIAYDTNGGTWVYESLGDRRFSRRRVNLDHSAGGKAFLSGGIASGTRIVVDGAAELWGFEFGTGK